MVLHFHLRYRTEFGQQIYLVSNLPSGQEGQDTAHVVMQYVNIDYWKVSLTLPNDFDDVITYYYLVKNTDGLQIFDGEEHRFIELASKKREKTYFIYDTWNDAGNINNVYFSKVFRNNLLSSISSSRSHFPKVYTHEFRVKAPMLQADETICLLGSTLHFGNWNTESPILLIPKNNWFVARIKLNKNEWPASYKYGIYNTASKKFIRYESGENRLLRNIQNEHGITIFHDGFVNTPTHEWRGTGVNIPVFSLRSKKSFGVGEFSDLKLLIDWCVITGIKLIQLLPINDTSAQNNWKDSYPYAAISAFALHPIYINLEKVAGKKEASIIKKISRKQKLLNDLQKMDYDEVMKHKKSLLAQLYENQKTELKDDLRYFEFFEMNRHWLVPYAAFCYLKEKYKTSDFQKWKKYAVYSESEIQKLVSPNQKHYDKIAIHYYTQYHLHLQLKEIALYAHKHKITLKGDLPIGIYRYSCDAWLAPSLFNMEEQAGAPPDDFSLSGQNWGFPTYNWIRMKENQFRWWHDRFDHIGKYFDAIRIDHILGFFRIWSIPIESLEGTLGRFVPAIPIDISEFERNHIFFDKTRYCTPYITDEILREIFGNNKEKVINELLIKNEETYALKEPVASQSKAIQYLDEIGLPELKDGILQLISNVILLEEKDSGGTKFHFRIDIQKTLSFHNLDAYTQKQLLWLYNNYFFERQDYFWRKEAMQKLPLLKRSTRMLVCGEDLGMVPHCVPQVMEELGILGLNVERMPKAQGMRYFNPKDAPYLSIVQPSTHDMSTIREWWKENRDNTQYLYNHLLHFNGEAPEDCTPEIAEEIIKQHLQSPAMWSIFLLQDLLAMEGNLSKGEPKDERINIPAEANHYWRYRMNLFLEDLKKQQVYNTRVRELITQNNRLHQN